MEVSPYGAILATHREALDQMAQLEPNIIAAARIISDGLRVGKAVLTCGNGGSAADAQHIAAELVGRFLKEREGWPAIDLVSNSPTLTAIANDYGYERVFARQVEAHATNAACVIGVSTSGNSANVVLALEEANQRGIPTIAMTGGKGGKVAEIANVVLKAPSPHTPRIQEMHLIFLHAICELVENELTA